MGDSKCRHGGDWEGDLWSWYDHVELGQLCRIMRDVPSDEGLCCMLHVVLKREEVSDGTSCIHISLDSLALEVSLQLTLTLTTRNVTYAH